MIFGKTKEPQSPASRGWPEPNKKYQRIRIAIEKVLYSVSGSYAHWSIELEGKTNADPLKDIVVVVSFELLEPFETPSRLKGAWSEAPEFVEGSCSWNEMDSPIHPSQLCVTLYCQRKGVDTLFQTLSVVGRPGYKTVVDFELDCPGATAPDFWLTEWMVSDLRVRTWRIICGSD